METIVVKRMRILDANSEWFGVSAIDLMEKAGRDVAKEANKLGKSFAIVCGSGNNGGDGFTAARYLKSKPKIFYIGRPRTNEAYENYMRVRNYRPIPLSTENLDRLQSALSEADVVIDALFGTGVTGKLREPARTAIQMINGFKKKIVSVDVPSGMDPDTGKVQDVAVKPTLTVSMHATKVGLKGNKAAGRVVVSDIGIHPKAETHVGKGDFKFEYPGRKVSAHKGDAGKVLVVGGSENYTGAPYFAAMAALRSGCDLAYVAAPKKAAARIATMAPNLIIYPLKSEDALSSHDVMSVTSKGFDVLCIGNGLGDDKASLEAARNIIRGAKKPMVIDGDGLKAVKSILPKLGGNVILTPHAGEFKALFDVAANEKNLKKVANKYKCLILLKGSVDIIAQKTRLKYNDSGNPYMSKGGTGDILAGMCAGFMAQGIEPFRAACFAALVNGVAGEIAFAEDSIGMTASDVLSWVSTAERLLLD